MFVAEADTTCLRQGDILANIPFLLVRPFALRVIGTFSQTGEGADFRPVESTQDGKEVAQREGEDTHWLTAQISTRLGFAAVISQCCDLAPRMPSNKILLPTIALARLVPITRATVNDPKRLDSLRANKDPRDSNNPGIIKLFHIPAHDKLGGVEWTVDYNQVLSIPSSEFPAIMQHKVLQMDDDYRIRFKIKLAWCLGRLTDEELALNHPWLASNELLEGPADGKA